MLWLYSHSLSIAFLLLFLASFAVHAVGGAEEYSEDQRAHGQPAVTVLQYMGTSRFWFESLQNWQSEFLSLLAMVVLVDLPAREGLGRVQARRGAAREHGEDEPKLVPVPVDARSEPVAQPA